MSIADFVAEFPIPQLGTDSLASAARHLFGSSGFAKSRTEQTTPLKYFVLAALLVVIAPFALQAAALEPGCLEIVPRPNGIFIPLQADVTNHCGKAVTAYALSAEVLYKNGTSAVFNGANEDFVLGLQAPIGDAPIGKGFGAMQPEETRPIHEVWVPVPDEQKSSISAIKVHASAVIFADSTAIGSEININAIFENRTIDLREFRFWRDVVAQFKPQIHRGMSLRPLLDSANVAEREKQIQDRRRPKAVAVHAEMMKELLDSLDAQVLQGKLTAPDAIGLVESYLEKVITNLSSNYLRR